MQSSLIVAKIIVNLSHNSLLTYWHAINYPICGYVQPSFFAVMSVISVSPVIFLTRWVRYRVCFLMKMIGNSMNVNVLACLMRCPCRIKGKKGEGTLYV